MNTSTEDLIRRLELLSQKKGRLDLLQELGGYIETAPRTYFGNIDPTALLKWALRKADAAR
jgi:hypothetical protein